MSRITDGGPVSASRPQRDGVGRRGTAANLSLRDWLGSTMPPDASAEQVEAVYGRRATLRVDPAVLEDRLVAWTATGGARRDPIVDALQRGVTQGLKYDAVYREHHGGRRYAYAVPGHRGPVVLSHHAWKRLPRPRAVLQSTPGALRPAVLPPVGHLFLDVDLRGAFPAIAAAVARDPAMQADVDDDIHRRVGEALVPRALHPRAVGKALNNSLISGMTPFGVRRDLGAVGVPLMLSQAQALHAAWWARYPGFAVWVAGVEHLLRGQACANQGVHFAEPTGRTYSYGRAEVRGWDRDRDGLDPVAGARSILSSLWRAAEGAILDRALVLLHERRDETHRLNLAIPMYDGALFVVPEDNAEHGRAWVRWAFETALWESHVRTGATVDVRERW